jgi:hypothetical protein
MLYIFLFPEIIVDIFGIIILSLTEGEKSLGEYIREGDIVVMYELAVFTVMYGCILGVVSAGDEQNDSP